MASSPAPMASRVVESRALTRSSGTPNSPVRSRAPARPASLMTSAGSVMVSNRGAPSALFRSRVIPLSAMAWRSAAGTGLISCWPASIRDRLSSPNTRSPPGSPSAVPVITTGPRRGASPPPSTMRAAWPMKSSNSLPSCSYFPAPAGPAALAAAVAAAGATARGRGVMGVSDGAGPGVAAAAGFTAGILRSMLSPS